MRDSTHEFSTKDLELAAYLFASGVALRELDRRDPHNVQFIFDTKSDDELEGLLRAFAQGIATTNVQAYNNARKYLLRRLKEER